MSFSDKMTLFYQNKFYIIILILLTTAFIHLWNPIGFPSVHVDEGTYMFRAMHFLTTGNTDWDTSFYDHPYFGPIFLASILYVINYPSMIGSDVQNNSSVYSSYIIPRIIMGLFVIMDTLLIYAIAKFRYGRQVAIISAILFSVMPFTWALRRIYLESLLFPLVLSSILIIVYLNSLNSLKPKASQILIFLSGILLGLSIFTKAPLVAMLPLLVYYVYKYNKKIPHVVLFLAPVLLIALIWPVDAIFSREYEEWVLGISSQIERQNDSILNSLYDIFFVDPIILILGLAGLVFAIIKRDTFLVLGIIPFVVFFSFFISYVNWFYLIPIFGFLCISSGILLERFMRQVNKYKTINFMIPVIVISFGAISTCALISTNIASFQFEAMSYVNSILSGDLKNRTILDNSSNHQTEFSNDLLQYDEFQNGSNLVKEWPINRSTVIIASPIYSWIYKFIYQYDNTFYSYSENKDIKNGSGIILILDRYFRDYLTNNEESRNNSWNQNLATSDKLYAAFNGLNTSKYFTGTSKNYDLYQYPYTSIRFNLGGSPIEIRSN
jgi:hypothetical protein